MAAKATPVTDRTFEEVVGRAPVPVVVDFWAAWCPPCRQIAPLVDELAGAYDGRVRFVKLNVDENPDVAGHYNVRSIPTLGIFRNGNMIDRLIGFMPKQELMRRIESALAVNVA